MTAEKITDAKTYLKGPKYNEELVPNVIRVTDVIKETPRKSERFNFQFKCCKTEWVKNELYIRL